MKLILVAFLCTIVLYGKAQSSWEEIGIGNNALNADSVINSLALDNNGNIYAAGLFRNANRKQYIAHWNGTSWSQLGNFEANGFVYDLQTDKSGNLYGGGLFRNSSGYCYVAKWDGNSWTDLGSLNANDAINRITIDIHGNIYAAGAFATLYPTPHCYVAKWNGRTWSELGNNPSPFLSGGYFIPVATDSIGNVYAGGTGLFAGSTNRRYAAKWDGNAWNNMGLVINSPIVQFAINVMGEIYAIGYFTNAQNKNYVAKWDGSSWTELGKLNANAIINSITTDPAGNLYVVGDFTNADGKRYVAKWNGADWSEVGNLNGNNVIYRIISDAKGNLYTAGKFTNANGKQYVAMYPAEKIIPVDSIRVQTRNNALPQVSKGIDTLALEALIFPQTANQHVIWSIVPISGNAVITTDGLVLGKNIGTVWAKAISVTDRSKMDSILIHIVGIDSVKVQTRNNIPADITTDGGSLQLVSYVFPNSVSQDVKWSIIPITTTASINANGLVTATKNGTLWAKATSIVDTTKSDSILITISGQIIPIDSVKVHTKNNVPATITFDKGSLQLIANVFPINASQSVTWTLIPVSGNGTIDINGLVLAKDNGTIWAKATSTIDVTKSDSILVTISGQITPADSIKVYTRNNVPSTIDVLNGTLSMVANIFPSKADQSVIWSIVSISGKATIDINGIVHAQLNGMVWAKATSLANSSIADSMLVTISGQPIPVDSVKVRVQYNLPPSITTRNGSLQLVSYVSPTTADQSVIWQIRPLTGSATVNATGLVTATDGGTIWVKAISVADNTKSDSILISICPYRFKLKLYPNPARSLLNIEVTNPCGVVLFDNTPVVLLYNSVGIRIQSIAIKAQITQLNIDRLAPGMYFIKYDGGGFEATEKFIKQ